MEEISDGAWKRPTVHTSPGGLYERPMQHHEVGGSIRSIADSLGLESLRLWQRVLLNVLVRALENRARCHPSRVLPMALTRSRT